MAITFDKTLGYASANGTSQSFSTTGAVAAGGLIVVVAGIWRTSTPAMTVSGGSLAWTQARTQTSGDLRVSLWWAEAPSGLAAATAITCAGSGGTNGILFGGAAYTGHQTGSPTTGQTNAGTGASTAWNSGNVSATSGNAIIGGSWGDGSQRTSTTGATERMDVNSATTGQSLTIVDKLSVSGTDSLSGTWSGAIDHIDIAVEFVAASGGGGGPTVKNLAALGVG